MGQLLISLRELGTALDIGCGTGHFTRWMASRGLESTGLDLSAAMLNVARRRSSGIRYVQGAAEDLPFTDRSFDLAFSVTSLEVVAEALAIGCIAIAVGWFARQGTRRPTGTHEGTALDVLKERYARGEITREQFDQMRRDVPRPLGL